MEIFKNKKDELMDEMNQEMERIRTKYMDKIDQIGKIIDRKKEYNQILEEFKRNDINIKDFDWMKPKKSQEASKTSSNLNSKRGRSKDSSKLSSLGLNKIGRKKSSEDHRGELVRGLRKEQVIIFLKKNPMKRKKEVAVDTAAAWKYKIDQKLQENITSGDKKQRKRSDSKKGQFRKKKKLQSPKGNLQRGFRKYGV